MSEIPKGSFPSHYYNPSIAIRIPREMREQYESPKDFWNDLGEFFVAMVGAMDGKEWSKVKNEWKDGKLRWKNQIEFLAGC